LNIIKIILLILTIQVIKHNNYKYYHCKINNNNKSIINSYKTNNNSKIHYNKANNNNIIIEMIILYFKPSIKMYKHNNMKLNIVTKLIINYMKINN